MKNNLLILFFLSVVIFANGQSISTTEKSLIQQKTEALLDQYEIYFNLIGDVNEDQTARGQEFLASFTRLFDNEVAMVYNDLDPDHKTSPQMPPENYGRNILLWYPSSGVKCEIDKESIKMGTPEHLWGSSHYVDVKLQKSISGNYMDKTLNQRTHDLVFRISFKKEGQRIFYFKIAGIRQFNEEQATDFIQISENKPVNQLGKTIPQPPAQVETNQFESKKDGTFTDERDGNKYKWVKIGDQIWMAENLAFIPFLSRKRSKKEPRYYIPGFKGDFVESGKQSEAYITYGVLYNWQAALSACPEGWHLPSDEEWEKLALFISNDKGALIKRGDDWKNLGYLLKSKDLWKDAGRDSYGFNARSAGSDNVKPGSSCFFWSSTQKNRSSAYYRYIWGNDDFDRTAGSIRYGFSVRCVKN